MLKNWEAFQFGGSRELTKQGPSESGPRPCRLCTVGAVLGADAGSEMPDCRRERESRWPSSPGKCVYKDELLCVTN